MTQNFELTQEQTDILRESCLLLFESDFRDSFSIDRTNLRFTMRDFMCSSQVVYQFNNGVQVLLKHICSGEDTGTVELLPIVTRESLGIYNTIGQIIDYPEISKLNAREM